MSLGFPRACPLTFPTSLPRKQAQPREPMNGAGLGSPGQEDLGVGGARRFLLLGNPVFSSEEGGRLQPGLAWMDHWQMLSASLTPQASQTQGSSKVTLPGAEGHAFLP